MYRLPEEIENELQKKYPNEHIKSVIQSIFQSIVEKTLKDGSCHIRELGNFSSFVTYSGKSCSKVVRFKFKTAISLIEKIKTDKYLIENLPIKAKVPFTEEHQNKCNTELKLNNTKARIEANQLGKNKTREKLANQAVLEILNRISDEELKGEHD